MGSLPRRQGRVGPSFACPRPARADSLSQMIGDDPDMKPDQLNRVIQ